jgi:hypothetical protein
MDLTSENSKIEIGPEGLGYLNTTRKWTMFMAILGFIGIGLMIFGGLALSFIMKGVSSALPAMEGMEGLEGIEGVDVAGAATGIASGMMMVMFLIIAVIYFFPVLYLFKFSKHTKKALETNDAAELTLGLKNLKSYWLYLGVLVIIALSVYLIIFLVAGASLAFLSGIKG